MTQAQENRAKYLKAPTVAQIKEFIAELGVTTAQFERFYGIPYGTLADVYSGKRDISSKFWHIIFLKKKPTYGVGFNTDKSKNHFIKNIIKKPRTLSVIGADRLSTLLNAPS